MIEPFQMIIIDTKQYLVLELLFYSKKDKQFIVYDYAKNKILFLEIDFHELSNILEPSLQILNKALYKLNNKLDVYEKDLIDEDRLKLYNSNIQKEIIKVKINEL